MAEAQRGLLTREAGRAGRRQVGHQRLVFFQFAALLQGVLKLIGHVEMVFDHRFVAPGDEDEMFDAGFARLVDDVLQDWAVDDRHHLLGGRLGRGQKARAETRDRKDGLADFFHHEDFVSSVASRVFRYSSFINLRCGEIRGRRWRFW